MVRALAGDSTMTSELPFPRFAAGASGSTAFGFRVFTAFGFFTMRFLAATSQPFVNRARWHLYHPALSCASRTTSAAICAAPRRSVSICACDFR